MATVPRRQDTIYKVCTVWREPFTHPHTHTHTHTPAIPCRSSGNVIKTTNYWDVLQPRCGRRSTMGHVGKAVAFQGMEIPGRKRRIISSQVENCRGQPTEAESGCQRRPLCAPVTRTYRERRRTSRNTHTHTHTHGLENPFLGMVFDWVKRCLRLKKKRRSR